MFIAFFLYSKQIFSSLKESKKLQLYFGSLTLMMIVTVSFSEVQDRVFSAIEKVKIFKYELNTPSVLKGMLVKDKNTVEQFDKISKFIEDYKRKRPEAIIVSLEMYNQLFMAFLSSGKPFSILPSSVFTYGKLENRYQFFDSLESFIQKNKPMLFSDKPIDREGYKEYFSYRFKTNIEYQAGVGYFYIPEN